jgi:phage recombination protein Bet
MNMAEKKKSDAVVKKGLSPVEIMNEFQAKTMAIWEDREAIKKMLTGTNKHPVSDDEFDYYIAYGGFMEANPLIREIWLIKYAADAPAQIFLGRDFYRRKAQEHKQYAGHYAVAVYSKDEFQFKNGVVDHKFSVDEDRGELRGAYCVVRRKDREVDGFVWVNFNEYDTKQSLWKTKRATMIAKVAESQAFRAAFSMFGGTYDESEQWKETNPDNVELDPQNKVEIVDEEVRGHDDTGFGEAKKDGGIEKEPELEKEKVEVVQEQAEKKAKEKIHRENGEDAPPLDDGDALPEKNNNASSQDKRQRLIAASELLRAQIGKDRKKQSEWLASECERLFGAYGIVSWSQVKYEWLDEIEKEIGDIANPNL